MQLFRTTIFAPRVFSKTASILGDMRVNEELSKAFPTIINEGDVTDAM